MQFWTNVVARNFRERIALQTTAKCAVNSACNPMLFKLSALQILLQRNSPFSSGFNYSFKNIFHPKSLAFSNCFKHIITVEGKLVQLDFKLHLQCNQTQGNSTWLKLKQATPQCNFEHYEIATMTTA